MAGGWQLRTRACYADAIRAAQGDGDAARDLTPNEALVLTIIAYRQPVTRGAIARLTGREVSRDLIGRLSHQVPDLEALQDAGLLAEDGIDLGMPIAGEE
ncbi:SMC-Scp complex subunit ScpB [Paracoccus laeviglucosivorans]|uniref:SMC-Scp complex subunit ScpB n=1 Tax=Paracoccus laeviglucosivorans TaxID=1197861 RepID=UPI003CCC89BE